MSKDHWRITTAAIQLEMERIAGLLEKSIHFHSRTSAPHALRQRHETACTTSQRETRRAHSPAVANKGDFPAQRA